MSKKTLTADLYLFTDSNFYHCLNKLDNFFGVKLYIMPLQKLVMVYDKLELEKNDRDLVCKSNSIYI